MARNDINQISVVGFEAPSIPELADKVQTELIDAHVGKKDYSLNVLQQYFWNPSAANENYGQMIYYSLDKKEDQSTHPINADAKDRPRGKK